MDEQRLSRLEAKYRELCLGQRQLTTNLDNMYQTMEAWFDQLVALFSVELGISPYRETEMDSLEAQETNHLEELVERRNKK